MVTLAFALSTHRQKTVEISQGDRIAQGIFEVYLTADGDTIQGGKRKGGFGSSGK